MGFSVFNSAGPHILLRNSHQKTLKLQSLNENVGCARNFNFLKSRSYPGRVLLSQHKSSEFEERTSPNEVRKEIEGCYELIKRLGRGVVYLGSSRMGPDHPHYQQALELSRKASQFSIISRLLEYRLNFIVHYPHYISTGPCAPLSYVSLTHQIASLLDCTSWSGAGPGLMDATTKGALLAGKPVGGFKIGKEAGEWTASNFHPYLPSETYLTCRFFSARKHGLVDAAVRSSSSDRTAVVALPGGIGTLDEVFEILALMQLERIGTELPVPFLLMNYDSFYAKLLEFVDDCEKWGTVSKGEVGSLWKVCNDNTEALAYLTGFYDLALHDKENKK